MTASTAARFLIEIVALISVIAISVTVVLVIATFADVTHAVEIAVTEVVVIEVVAIVIHAVVIPATVVSHFAEFSVWGIGFKTKYRAYKMLPKASFSIPSNCML
jgi:predicted membrane protein